MNDRIIKFRAWDIYFKKMFNVIRLEFLFDGINVVLDDKEKSYSDGCELMQYVGLKDKNGKEIYQSDIIKGHGVGFSTTHSEVYFGCDGAQIEIGDLWIQLSAFREREIIGNKYEEKVG